MAVVYSNTGAITTNTALKDNRLVCVRDAINGKVPATWTGAGATAILIVGTASLATTAGTGAQAGELVRFTLPNPVASVSGGVLTFLGTPINNTGTAVAGTAALAQIRDGAGAVIVSGLTVGITGSGADVIIDSITISAGQVVTFVSGTITHS
jgi:hypothetical protein